MARAFFFIMLFSSGQMQIGKKHSSSPGKIEIILFTDADGQKNIFPQSELARLVTDMFFSEFTCFASRWYFSKTIILNIHNCVIF